MQTWSRAGHLLLAGVGIIGWHVSRLQTNLIMTMAVASADLHAQAIEEFRTLYTSEVVERVRTRGIEVVRDYQSKPGAIPLPATLSIKLGQSIGAEHLGAETRLYSPFPFPPGRQGIHDDFGQDAWDSLRETPTVLITVSRFLRDAPPCGMAPPI